MDIREHSFTARIQEILVQHFGPAASDIFRSSLLLRYINEKTRSAARGSKSRGAFANHYALYVVIEDYINKGYSPGGKGHGRYEDYEGARFSDLFRRQRELPFGQKLQNHALNTRLNDEFRKFFPDAKWEPIVRDVSKQRYWIQEDLLNVTIRGTDGKRHTYNIAAAVIDIIDAYVAAKQEAFEAFVQACNEIAKAAGKDEAGAFRFIESQLQPNVDARVFEIVSFSVLKYAYGEQNVYWGWTRENLTEERLALYKTGRTNANDGGIDFVMKPLGRFFQVTETLDVNKYFLDIDKIQRFPLTFVVKSNESIEAIRKNIESQAIGKYKIKAVVASYMDAVEEVINVPILLGRLEEVAKAGKLGDVMSEVVRQSRVEFNYVAEDEAEAEEQEDMLAALFDA